MEYDYPIVILGAGPAGAWAALRLAEAGLPALVLERAQPGSTKLCGGLLNRRGQAALGCTLPQHVRREPVAPPLEYHDCDNHVRFSYDPGYWNMHRGRFDDWLRERAADAGAKLRYGVQAMGLALEAGGVRVQTGAGEVRAHCVLDATGWRSLSRKLLAPPEGQRYLLHTIQGRISGDMPHDAMWAIYRSAVTPFYGWLIPQGDGRFLLGYGAPAGHTAPGRQGDAAARGAWAPLAPYLDYIRKRGYTCLPLDPKPRGCPLTLTPGLDRLWWGAGAVFPLGEAAGLVSPSSGGGVHYALEHAAALVRVLQEHGAGAAALGAGGGLDRHAVISHTQALLRPQLSQLRFSCLKAWIAARPMLRGPAAQLLPLFTRSSITHLP